MAEPRVEMDNALWRLAHMLAADLALNRVSKNLVQNFLAFLQRYPGAAPAEYAGRLQQLNAAGHFDAGKSGPYEREDLCTALLRVETWPDAARTRLALGWVTRLVDYYADPANRDEAIRRSGLEMLALRPGERLPGKVRQADKKNVWVRVHSGQWGRAQCKGDIEIGAEVDVNVRRVTDPVTFDVDIVAVTRRIPRERELHEGIRSKPDVTPELDISPERDAEIRAKADEFMALLQKKQSGKKS